jgi:hypothetical protein
MQKMLAGMNPYWPVCHPIKQMITLLMEAITKPIQCLRPTIKVEKTVSKQEK